ncbi:hypothetical protein, partial [Pseudomonas syringae]|uniref:hypothetical protein n=1 Tax=Pseudomonas syringae TaxID=317 RepID=UPI001E30B887
MQTLIHLQQAVLAALAMTWKISYSSAGAFSLPCISSATDAPPTTTRHSTVKMAPTQNLTLFATNHAGCDSNKPTLAPPHHAH